jgi:hypothetical protein
MPEFGWEMAAQRTLHLCHRGTDLKACRLCAQMKQCSGTHRQQRMQPHVPNRTHR